MRLVILTATSLRPCAISAARKEVPGRPAIPLHRPVLDLRARRRIKGNPAQYQFPVLTMPEDDRATRFGPDRLHHGRADYPQPANPCAGHLPARRHPAFPVASQGQGIGKGRPARSCRRDEPALLAYAGQKRQGARGGAGRIGLSERPPVRQVRGCVEGKFIRGRRRNRYQEVWPSDGVCLPCCRASR